MGIAVTAKCPKCGRKAEVTVWPFVCCGTKYSKGMVPLVVSSLNLPSATPPSNAKEPQGLGDWTEQGLKRIGITPERYVEAKRLFGLRPTCGCQGRKQWLNKVGEWFAGLPEQQRQHEHDQKDGHADRGKS